MDEQKPADLHAGPPPAIDWWPTVDDDGVTALRWWDGEYWSIACLRTDTAEEAGRKAALKSSLAFWWHDKWWR